MLEHAKAEAIKFVFRLKFVCVWGCWRGAHLTSANQSEGTFDTKQLFETIVVCGVTTSPCAVGG